jgi:hypothetical protein
MSISPPCSHRGEFNFAARARAFASRVARISYGRSPWPVKEAELALFFPRLLQVMNDPLCDPETGVGNGTARGRDTERGLADMNARAHNERVVRFTR